MAGRQHSSNPGGQPRERARSTQLNIARDSASLFGEIVALETRAASLVAREMLQRQRELAAAANSFARLSGPYVDPRNALEIQKISRSWFDLMTTAQGVFLQTLAAPFTWTAGNAARPAPNPGGHAGPDRRVSAHVIPFPDRRAAGG